MSMIRRITFMMCIVLASAVFVHPAHAQGPTTGECDDQCGRILDDDGQPDGYGCRGGRDRNRTNCKATRESCTTDPCEGFAILNGDGALVAIGGCRERSEFSAPTLKAVAETNRITPRPSNANHATRGGRHSSTERSRAA